MITALTFVGAFLLPSCFWYKTMIYCNPVKENVDYQLRYTGTNLSNQINKNHHRRNSQKWLKPLMNKILKTSIVLLLY